MAADGMRFTSNDYTAYYETLPADKISVAQALESDRMQNSVFDPEEVEAERTVILSEREGYENTPQFVLREEVQATAYKAHPYQWGDHRLALRPQNNDPR